MSILSTLFPYDIYKGLKLTGRYFGRNFFSANRKKVRANLKHITVEYPEVPVHLQPRFRGRLQMLRDEQGEIKCICCLACERICPTQVITIEKDRKDGRKLPFPKRYTFEMERCIFCEFCVEACAYDSIILNHQFELAAYNREDFSHGTEGAFQNMFKPTPVGTFSVAADDDANAPHY